MNESTLKPNPDGLIKLSGTIKNLKVTRCSASFVFTSDDQTKLGILAVASALTGLDGQAATALHYANDVEEPADYLEFELGDQVVKGWVWRNPFKEADVVSLAADKVGNHWEFFGIVRPSDHMVAMYPHCARGEIAHYKNTIKWCILFCTSTFTLVFFPLMYFVFKEELFETQEPWVVVSFVMLAFSVMSFSLARKWLPFARVAEKVFRALDLPNPSSIDLIKSSKAKRKPQDSGEYGTFYFRY
jgi:hypothetical protein